MNDKKQKAFQFVDEHRDEMVSLWKEVVSMESGPHEKAGINLVAAHFKKILEAEGASSRMVEFEKAGSMLIAEIDKNPARPGVIFMGHMDTACPAGAIIERPFTIKDGKAYGPGVLDMKGGIVSALYAIKALNAAGYDSRSIKVLLAGDEEVLHAHSTAPDIFIEEARGYAAAFNVETGFVDDGIVVGRKGVARIMMEVKGVAAHAGNDPENGRSAILEMAHKIIAVQNLTDWEKGISFNVGVMQGGTTSTAVPDYAKIYIDVRYKDPDDLPEIIKQIEGVAEKIYIAGTTASVVFMDGIKPMKTTEGVKQLFEIVKKAYEENGFGTPYAKSVGGGSDSAYTVLAGVPTVCAMGVKGGRNHSPEEYAIVESLFERAKLMVACVLKLDSN
ncbi:M20 family metallopeptidase [Sporomusa malonica]|uniref:Glutamate carboxypeptidase n=1 Tax=Sporomusa malonica TaxID=112901 RepID=A0A1W2EU55_9FIRM|nr:M20 family metallopeptidase [Sporomusa malonica]SMD12708.1 glutamate carboxypeptidase [Sporomusa malonica]